MSIQNTGADMTGLGLGEPVRFAGIPSAGTDEVQRITITGTPTGGTFNLKYDGYTTTDIAYNAAAADVVAALEALPSIGTGNVTGSGGALPGSAVSITFTAGLGRKNVSTMTAVGSFTGGSSPAIAITTPTAGVAATARGVAKGGLLIDTTNGNLYINQGTPLAPVWGTATGIMAAFGAVAFDRAVKVAKVALGATDTGGGVLSWQNPESGAIVVSKVVLDVTTKSTAACTVDVGTTAANGTTLSDNLIDGIDVGTAAICSDNHDNAGSNGKSVQKLATGKWVTGSMATGAAAGLVGSAYIYYINV